MEALELFKESLEWLKNKYNSFHFFKERDIVWELQKYLLKLVEEEQLPYKIFNDYRLWKKGPLCDLVIMRNKKIEIIIEFKYEPSHKRAEDFPASKLEQCFVFWGGKSNKHSVEQDIRRVKDFVKTGKTKIGFSIFIDEGRFFWRKKPHPGSQWENWGDVAVLISQVG